MILRIYFRRDLLTVKIARTYQGRKPAIISAANLVNSIEGESRSSSIIEDAHLTKTSSIILLLTIAGFIISEFLHFVHIANIGLSVIALLGAGALYLLNGKDRIDILKRVDYTVLAFFAAMFVFTSALWSSGMISLIMSHIPSPSPNNFPQSNAIISAVSVLLSQILSNVPFVALYNRRLVENLIFLIVYILRRIVCAFNWPFRLSHYF